MSNNCLRCGYTWSARSNNPLRCPRCKSTRWSKEVINDVCLRCGAEWVQRSGEVPKYCPICHSSMWNAEKISYTCPKCGKTRTLRSNSRSNLCPVCDVYADRRKAEVEDFKSPISGISNVIHLWTDDTGLTFNYIDNGRGIAYLYDQGKLIGEINIDTWCRSQGMSFPPENKIHDIRYQSIFAKAVEKIKSGNKVNNEKYTNVETLRGVTAIEAEIISLSELGMAPLPIALKLNIPFTNVMDVLESIPPMIRGNDLSRERIVERTPTSRRISPRLNEKV